MQLRRASGSGRTSGVLAAPKEKPLPISPRPRVCLRSKSQKHLNPCLFFFLRIFPSNNVPWTVSELSWKEESPPSFLSFTCSIFNHVEAKSHSSETWLCSPSYLEALCVSSRPRPPRRLFPPNTEATVPMERRPSENNIFPVGPCLDKCSWSCCCSG